MKSKKTAYFLVIFGMIFMAYSLGCKTTKNESPESGKNIPGGMAISPSSFRCEGIVEANDSQTISLRITKMLEQGSSLFYSVSSGDIIQAKFQSPNKTDFSSRKNVEALIEERMKLNSDDRPEFIVRQIK